MRKKLPYIILPLAILLLAVSLMAIFWNYRVSAPKGNWSKEVITVKPEGKTTSYQMMIYADRPIMRTDQKCRTYLRIRNTGNHPLELTSTYITNKYYEDGVLFGEEIGDWELPDAHLKLLPGEIEDILYPNAIIAGHYRVSWNHIDDIGTRGFQFYGFGLQTNTVTVYVLPSRLFWIILAAISALAVWRAWLGIKSRSRQSQ
ncbi:MAG: hypothetical protein ACYC27_07400 [Armatimonadota bacterium]